MLAVYLEKESAYDNIYLDRGGHQAGEGNLGRISEKARCLGPPRSNGRYRSSYRPIVVRHVGERHLAPDRSRGRPCSPALRSSGRPRLLPSERRTPVITGTVTEDFVPTITLPVAGKIWPTIVDTGFNGDLELPEELRPFVHARYPVR